MLRLRMPSLLLRGKLPVGVISFRFGSDTAYSKKPRKEKSLKSFSRFVNKSSLSTELGDLCGSGSGLAGPYRCVGIHFGTSLQLNDIYSSLKKEYPITCFSDQSEEYDVLHVQYKQKHQTSLSTRPVTGVMSDFKVSSKKDIFLFREGSAVCWGMDNDEEDSWFSEMKEHADRCSYELSDLIKEEINAYRGPNTCIVSDNIVLSTSSPPELRQKEMLAYSYGVARSMQLEWIEEEVSKPNSITQRVIAIPKVIKSGKLPNRNEWAKITGEHMELRCKLNLNSTLLDAPDIFWEDYDMGLLFQEMQENLEITDRIETLNKRLDMIEQIILTVQSSLTDKYSHKLEVIIIVLISLEVSFYLLDKNTYWENLRWDLQ